MAEDPTPLLDRRTGIVTEPERWNNTPGSPNGEIPPQPGVEGTISADISAPYVAAGINNWFTNWTRVLPFPVDDLTTDFGFDLYQKMLYDPAVITGINVYRANVLEQGIQLSPAVSDKGDQLYDDSIEILRASQKMFEEMDGDFDEKLWNLEEACALGNKVGELRWTLDRLLTGDLMWRLRDVSVKPQVTVAFAVDTYKHIVGLLGLVPGVGFPVQIGTILPDPSRVPNLLPRDKFIIRSFRPRDNDPRGTSLARAAYTAWNLKMQIYASYLQWLTQFASPSLFGFTGPGAIPRPKTDDLGNPILDGNGNPIMISAQQLMADKLADMKNSTVAAFPYESKVQPVEMRGQGAPFINAFHFLNEEITQSIQHQPLTTQAAQYGTRSQAGVHQNVQGTIVRQGKKSTARMVKLDILRKFVRYNWGPGAVPLTPLVGLGEMEQHDFAANAAGIASLNATHYFDETQVPGLDEMLGAPQRGDDWEKRWKAAQALAAGAQQQVRGSTGPSNAAVPTRAA